MIQVEAQLHITSDKISWQQKVQVLLCNYHLLAAAMEKGNLGGRRANGSRSSHRVLHATMDLNIRSPGDICYAQSHDIEDTPFLAAALSAASAFILSLRMPAIVVSKSFVSCPHKSDVHEA